MAKTKASIPALDNASRLGLAQKSAQEFAQSDLLSQDASSHIKEALQGADFKLWEAVRNAWEAAYTGERKCDAASANRAWQRLVAAADLKKPKSTSTASTAKAAQLQAKQAATAALKVKTAEGLTVMREDLAKKALTGDTSALKQVADINKELQRREDEAKKAERDHLKSVQSRVRELVGKCEDVETLAKVEALLAAAVQAQNAPKVVPTAAPATKTGGKRRAA